MKHRLAKNSLIKPYSEKRTLLVIIAIVTVVGVYALISSKAATTSYPPATLCPGNTKSPTQAGRLINNFAQVDDGAGKTVCIKYGVYRPLTGRGSTNKTVAPVVVETNPHSVSGPETWFHTADKYGFVVIRILNTHVPAGGGTPQYSYFSSNPDPGSVGFFTCGTSGTALCDDNVWTSQIMDAVACAGTAGLCENLDSNNMFIAGGSKGGSFTESVLCDPLTSFKFKGYAVASAGMISPSTNATVNTPPNCPAVLNTHNYGTGVTIPPRFINPPQNHNFSIQWLFGTLDSSFGTKCTTTCDKEIGWVDAKNRWNFGQAQLAGDSSLSGNVFGSVLGCTGTPVTTNAPTAGTPGGDSNLVVKTYGSCNLPGIATSYLKAVGGLHSFPGLIGTPYRYSTGTIAQSGTAITGTGTTFPSWLDNGLLEDDQNFSLESVNYINSTSLTGSVSKTIPAGNPYEGLRMVAGTNTVYGLDPPDEIWNFWQAHLPGGNTTPAPTVNFSSNPTSISSGQSSTLTWSSSNATGCTASGGWTGSKAVSGSQSVSPGATTSYSLACSGAGGSTSATATVTVSAGNPAPTVTLTSSPSSITSGSSSTLTWSSANATGCTASGGWTGAKATSGTQAVTPSATTSYTLVCTGAGGTSSPANATVNVTTSTVTGDIDGSGHVDIIDLSMLLAKWGTTNAACDLNNDNIVNMIDLSILISHYGL
jgi:PKD repeat protein